MTPEMEALGRRAVEAGLKWATRQRVRMGGRWGTLVELDGGSLIHVSEGDGSDAGFPPEWKGADPLLDVGDPATLGTLIAQAREALGEPCAYAGHINGEWYIDRDGGGEPEGLDLGGEWGAGGAEAFICEPSEPAAWVAALEAAGRRKWVT